MNCSDRGRNEVHRRTETDLMVGKLKKDTVNDFVSGTRFPVMGWQKIFPY